MFTSTATPQPKRMPRAAGRGEPLGRYLARRRLMRRAALLVLLILIVIGLWVRFKPSPIDALDRRPATVLQVVGPTSLRLAVAGDKVGTVVGLLGVKPRENADDRCVEGLIDAIGGKPVVAAFDNGRLTDADGRPAAYVYAHDGAMLNEHLIQSRAAQPDESQHLLGDWFSRLYRRVNPPAKAGAEPSPQRAAVP